MKRIIFALSLVVFSSSFVFAAEEDYSSDEPVYLPEESVDSVSSDEDSGESEHEESADSGEAQ